MGLRWEGWRGVGGSSMLHTTHIFHFADHFLVVFSSSWLSLQPATKRQKKSLVFFFSLSLFFF